MFIHLGGDTLVSSKKIVAILNAEHTMGANTTKEFIKLETGKGSIIELDGDNYKSIIITDHYVYLSPISSLTLKKRAGFVAEL